ncbi:hypothetical protein DFH09DRAFT_1073640 [Mycena vulgaris]|nr:hypothetical protein DFH09DRAFT_1073640 [Mycena vulgaris]
MISNGCEIYKDETVEVAQKTGCALAWRPDIEMLAAPFACSSYIYPGGGVCHKSSKDGDTNNSGDEYPENEGDESKRELVDQQSQESNVEVAQLESEMDTLALSSDSALSEDDDSPTRSYDLESEGEVLCGDKSLSGSDDEGMLSSDDPALWHGGRRHSLRNVVLSSSLPASDEDAETAGCSWYNDEVMHPPEVRKSRHWSSSLLASDEDEDIMEIQETEWIPNTKLIANAPSSELEVSDVIPVQVSSATSAAPTIQNRPKGKHYFVASSSPAKGSATGPSKGKKRKDYRSSSLRIVVPVRIEYIFSKGSALETHRVAVGKSYCFRGYCIRALHRLTASLLPCFPASLLPCFPASDITEGRSDVTIRSVKRALSPPNTDKGAKRACKGIFIDTQAFILLNKYNKKLQKDSIDAASDDNKDSHPNNNNNKHGTEDGTKDVEYSLYWLTVLFQLADTQARSQSLSGALQWPLLLSVAMISRLVCSAPGVAKPNYTMKVGCQKPYTDFARVPGFASRTWPAFVTECTLDGIQYIWKWIVVLMDQFSRFRAALNLATQTGAKYVDPNAAWVDINRDLEGPGVYSTSIWIGQPDSTFIQKVYIGESMGIALRVGNHLGPFKESPTRGRGEEPRRSKHKGHKLFRLEPHTPDPLHFFTEGFVIVLMGAADTEEGGQNVHTCDNVHGGELVVGGPQSRPNRQVPHPAAPRPKLVKVSPPKLVIDAAEVVAIYRAGLKHTADGMSLPASSSPAWKDFGTFHDGLGTVVNPERMENICRGHTYCNITGLLDPMPTRHRPKVDYLSPWAEVSKPANKTKGVRGKDEMPKVHHQRQHVRSIHNAQREATLAKRNETDVDARWLH